MNDTQTVIVRPFQVDILTEYGELLTRLECIRAEYSQKDLLTEAEREEIALREYQALLEMGDYRRKIETFMLQALRWCLADNSGTLKTILLEATGLEESVKETKRLRTIVEDLATEVIKLRDELQQVKTNGQARRTTQALEGATSESKVQSVVVAGIAAF